MESVVRTTCGMEEVLNKIGFALLGGFLTGTAYLLKRWLEKKPVLEEIEKHQKLLALAKEMNEQQLSIEALRQLEQTIIRKPQAIQAYIREIKEEIKKRTEKVEIAIYKPIHETKQIITQTEMNEQAQREYIQAEQKLISTIEKLKEKISFDDAGLLDKIQESWKEFRDKQAVFTAHFYYRGGSMLPLIYYSELERLTVERVAALQNELDEISKLWES